MQQRIGLDVIGAGLVRHIIFKARDDVAFQHPQQAGIDGLAIFPIPPARNSAALQST